MITRTHLPQCVGACEIKGKHIFFHWRFQCIHWRRKHKEYERFQSILSDGPSSRARFFSTFQIVPPIVDFHRREHRSIDPSHKSQNASLPYPIMQHFVTEMCTCVHISVTKWCIVGYLSDAFWDLWNGSISDAVWNTTTRKSSSLCNPTGGTSAIFITVNSISMGLYKKGVNPLLTRWSYVYLALTHRSDHLCLPCIITNIAR